MSLCNPGPGLEEESNVTTGALKNSTPLGNRLLSGTTFVLAFKKESMKQEGLRFPLSQTLCTDFALCPSVWHSSCLTFTSSFLGNPLRKFVVCIIAQLTDLTNC